MTALQLMEELASAISEYGDDLEVNVNGFEVGETWVDDAGNTSIYQIVGKMG
jgi:hypothetical protein